jgi:hypothetical protein
MIMPMQPDEDDSRVEGVNRRQWNGKANSGVRLLLPPLSTI